MVFLGNKRYGGQKAWFRDRKFSQLLSPAVGTDDVGEMETPRRSIF